MLALKKKMAIVMLKACVGSRMMLTLGGSRMVSVISIDRMIMLTFLLGD